MAPDPHVRYVARQPIFDRRRALVGYELLYRADAACTAAGVAASAVQMSSTTLVSGVLDIGLDRLTGGVPAWINVSRDLLVSDALEVLDPRRVVLELLESIEPDDEVIAAAHSLRRAGYTLALDDFVGGTSWDPLLRLARVVKLDVLGREAADLVPTIIRLRGFGVRLLAERVEDAAAFECHRGLGFDYFQGYHFQRPETVQRRVLPHGIARLARLMAMVDDPRVSDYQLEEELRADPGLSVKLLRIVNNASTGLREVRSIRHAVQLVGRKALQQWLALLLVSSIPVRDDVDRELVLLALERGRFCELLAIETGREDQADPLFLVGVLAGVDRLLGVPMPELVAQLGVSEDVAAALCGRPSPHTPYLELATAYADGAWDSLKTAAINLRHDDELPGLYGSAGGWAREVLTLR